MLYHLSTLKQLQEYATGINERGNSHNNTSVNCALIGVYIVRKNIAKCAQEAQKLVAL